MRLASHQVEIICKGLPSTPHGKQERDSIGLPRTHVSPLLPPSAYNSSMLRSRHIHVRFSVVKRARPLDSIVLHSEWSGCLPLHESTRYGMDKRQSIGMQTHGLIGPCIVDVLLKLNRSTMRCHLIHDDLRESTIGGSFTVKSIGRIANNWKSHGGTMNTQLMRPARHWCQLESRHW